MLQIEIGLNIAEFQKFLGVIDKAENGESSTFTISKCSPRYWEGSEDLFGFDLTIKVKSEWVVKEYEKNGLLEIINPFLVKH